jgi:inosine-uridine nucleoside N-ribohydrolase
VTSSSLRLAVRSRVVVDDDRAGDPDGLVALAHHLLSPTNRVDAVTSSFINPVFGVPEGATDGAALAQELADLIGVQVPVLAGSNGPFDGTASAAAEAIVREALRDDPLPLFVVCAGPLTNVAAALQQAPHTAGRFTLVWIGGALDPAADEYNRDTDRRAAEFVLATPGLQVWYFPLETYRRCAFSVVELEADLAGSGRVGAWLYERFLALPLPDLVQLGGVWPLGDSPPVLVTALSDESSSWQATPSGRLYTDVDVRLLFGDMLAKLRLHERRRTGA